MNESTKQRTRQDTVGPPAARLYAVEPTGVLRMTPSHRTVATTSSSTA